MTVSFEVELVNGLSGDPAVCVRFAQMGESLLFDAGSLESMSNRELLKVRVVAVSHTHVDHFIGFDRLLRVNVPHFRTVEVVGPKGITKNIQGKLAGYTWNLLDPDQVSFIVHEISRAGEVRSSHISNTWNFEDRPLDLAQSRNLSPNGIADVPLKTERYTLRAGVVDHGTDVLAFSLRMPPSVAVSKDSLAQSGLKPGPWIADIQRMKTNGDASGPIDVHGTTFDAKDLADRLLLPKSGEHLAYVTDMVFSEDNVRKLLALVKDSAPDILVCEANYRNEHRERAHQKCHLTTRQAALLAGILRAKKLQIFHISNVYGDDTASSVHESLIAFDELRELSPEELWQRASKEFLSYP